MAITQTTRVKILKCIKMYQMKILIYLNIKVQIQQVDWNIIVTLL